tara:strand:- start:789 stop:1310 length:522 start_codon:yes stop_codon:yes gene_type:complete
MNGKFFKIKSLSGTDVANLNLTDCFNDTYNLYEVLTTVKKSSGSSASNFFQRFIDSSGSVISASEYNKGYFRYDRYEAREYDTAQTSINVTSLQDADTVVSIRQSISNPYANDRYTAGYSSRYTYHNISGADRGRVFLGLAGLKNVQRITGIQTASSTGNIDVNIAVYAFGES